MNKLVRIHGTRNSACLYRGYKYDFTVSAYLYREYKYDFTNFKFFFKLFILKISPIISPSLFVLLFVCAGL